MAQTALNRAYNEHLELLRQRLTARVIAADGPDRQRFVSRVVDMVLEGQRGVVREVDVYLSTEAGLATGTSTEPWGLVPDELIGVKARRGDYLEDVYARNYRSSFGTFAERMSREVATDVKLAERGANFIHTAGDERITGYRRTLSSGVNCGLCIAAATRTYHKEDLAPMHLKCKCGVQPIYGPVRSWNKPTNDVLRGLYDQAGSTGRKDLIRIVAPTPTQPGVDIITTSLGPTLTRVPLKPS